MPPIVLVLQSTLVDQSASERLMRGSESNGMDDIPQAIQEILRKMPQRFWPEKYKKYASALDVCDKNSDSVSAEQLPDGNSRGASEHFVHTAVSNAMAGHT